MTKAPEKTPILDEPYQRLRWAREHAGFADATSAARRYHWNENTYRSHENSTRAISKPAALRYARAFKIDAGPGWLLYGGTSLAPSIDPEFGILWNNLTDNQRAILKANAREMVRKTT